MTAPAPHQAALLALPEMPAPEFFQKLEDSTGDYTAERFQSRRPDDYKLVIALLARGWGAQRIQDHFATLRKEDATKTLSKNTVKAIRALAGETIDLLRERLAAEAYIAADDYRTAAVTLLDEIMSNPHRRAKLTVRDVQSLEVASGIATQNAQLLAGLPTARLQLEDLKRPTHDDFNEQLKNLPAISIDPAATTHLVGETAAQKEGPKTEANTDRPSAATATIPTPKIETAADSQSDGDTTISQ